MMRRKFFIFVFVLFSFCVFTAEAEERLEKSEEVMVDESELILDEEVAFESTQWFSFHFRLGNYVPSKATGIAGNFQIFYSGKTALWYELALELQPITTFGVLGVRGIIGYQQIKARGGTGNTARFTNIPFQAGLIYNFKYLRHQSFVPFLEAGGSYYLLKQTNQNQFNETRKGYYGSVGLKLNLNTFEEKVADRFDLNYGINNTYITVEYRRVEMIGAGFLNLSGEFFLAGFSMEF